MNDDQWVVRVAPGYRVGPWRVTHGLASGNWGSVYAAVRDPDSADAATGPTQAALKFIPTGTLTPRHLAHLADMTHRELTVHRKISHPALIKVLDTYVVDDATLPRLDGATVLALELAERSAAAALAAADGGGLPDAPRMLVEITAGLAHLHQAGWVHGDLKPSNILLMADGSIRLADFGLAAEMDGTHALLPPGGTADYMPPERWAEGNGASGTAIRQTADIWALGVTACQLLTGRLPFSGATPRARMSAAAAYAAGNGELALPGTLPPQWRQFIVDCLAPDHSRRLRHPAAGLLARARVAAGDTTAPVTLRRSGLEQDGPRGWSAVVASPARRALAGAAAVVVAASGAAVVVLRPWDGAASAQQQPSAASSNNRYEQHFRTDSDIPVRYYDLIVQAGTKCPAEAAVKPYVVAAILKAESNFNPSLSDPAKDEFGIARWTPSVLQYYLPANERHTEPTPPFSPEMSIPPVGDFLCRFAPELRSVPGDRIINLVAAWRTSAQRVREAGGVPDRPALREYMPRLRAHLDAYRPTGAPTPAGN